MKPYSVTVDLVADAPSSFIAEVNTRLMLDELMKRGALLGYFVASVDPTPDEDAEELYDSR